MDTLVGTTAYISLAVLTFLAMCFMITKPNENEWGCMFFGAVLLVAILIGIYEYRKPNVSADDNRRPVTIHGICSKGKVYIKDDNGEFIGLNTGKEPVECKEPE